MKNSLIIIFNSLIITFAVSGLTSCFGPGADGFTHRETALVREADSMMRVLTIEDSLDLKVLRTPSQDLTLDMMLSNEFKRLSELMIATVTHPSQDGVGIAGPQVGLNRRVVAVQRFDKEGEPFEVYPNVRIVWASDSLAAGPEGCLSVPGRHGNVLRSQTILIEYADLDSLDRLTSAMTPREKRRHSRRYPFSMLRHHSHPATIPMARDTVTGFTAVIFQHETDHLDGILYIDRLEN